MWKCWLFGHDWLYKNVDSFTYRKEGFVKTELFNRKACIRCGKPNPNYKK